MIDQKQLTEWAKLAKNERVPDLEHRDLGRTAVPALIAEVERLRSALADAIAQMCSVSRELGELQGKASIMEHVHVLDDWREKCEGLEADVAKLREALTTIEAWDSFPETGRRWPSGPLMPAREEISYGTLFGPNGERDFMRAIARAALGETK